MIGGLGVGAALIIAPMYIAEIAPAAIRGRMVSFNQLNIVIGISAAFFSNYLILTLGQSDVAWAESLRLGEWNWRWMLGIETLPAILYFFALLIVPESPRWLAMQGRDDEALRRARTGQRRRNRQRSICRRCSDSIEAEAELGGVSLKALFHPSMKLVLTIGISVGILQQITGINSVFFYSPMIFEQSGIGTNACVHAGGARRPRQSRFYRRGDGADRQARPATAARLRSDRHRRLHADAGLRVRRGDVHAGSGCDRQVAGRD